VAHFYDMENMVPEECVAVVPVADGKLWQPC
jgi:hypothetical protein